MCFYTITHARLGIIIVNVKMSIFDESNHCEKVQYVFFVVNCGFTVPIVYLIVTCDREEDYVA